MYEHKLQILVSLQITLTSYYLTAYIPKRCVCNERCYNNTPLVVNKAYIISQPEFTFMRGMSQTKLKLQLYLNQQHSRTILL